MIEFNKIKRLFPKDRYECGVISGKDTRKLGKIKLNRYYHSEGAIIKTKETKDEWDKIKSSLIVLQYTDVAFDYNIKPKTKKILKPFSKSIKQLTLDLKTAAIEAGLAIRASNSTVPLRADPSDSSLSRSTSR